MEKKQDYMDRFETSNTQITNDIEDLLEFHPELLDRLSGEDQLALSKVFFAGREVDVEDVAIYHAQLQTKEPELMREAQAAYQRLVHASKSI
jgi:hypothetical protein